MSASQEDAQPRVWDLLSGEEIGRLRGHIGAVHCLQVEDHVCLTGGADGNVRLWDLRRVSDDDGWGEGEMVSLSDVPEEDEEGGELVEHPSAIRSSENDTQKDSPCERLLEGHTQAVTALYFEDECLVGLISWRTFSPILLNSSGHWSIGQNLETMGSHNRAMCYDHGHTLGNFTSCQWKHVGPDRQPVIPWELFSANPAVCRWNERNLRRFRRGCSVLGLWISERQRRRRCQDVG